jgi:hypothetical protein
MAVNFTIDYAKWRCGGDGPNKLGDGRTALLNDKGFMCCLGQVSLQLGLTTRQIFGKYAPVNVMVENILCERLTSGVFASSALAGDAMKINDNTETTPAEKMAALKELFAEHGHEIEFINVPQEQQQ